jgi:hypothetical protein
VLSPLPWVVVYTVQQAVPRSGNETRGEGDLARHNRHQDCRREAGVSSQGLPASESAERCSPPRELDSSRHSGVIALFQQHFVKTGVIGVDVARALPRAFAKRQNADYEDFALVSEEDACRVRRECEQFVAAAERIEGPPR